MRILVSGVALLAVFFSGCGGAEISHDDLTRDDAALRAHQYHEDLVQLAGDVDSHPDPSVPGSCDGTCEASPRVTDLAHRICDISERDPNDEATRFLCDDSREREASTSRRYAACQCGAAADVVPPTS
jgi:hypothetical protein